ncbi:uncharacterized protein C8A04DRAFT_40955 [Dichotomopilus funicola]|uniref:F-box domain-containing protein n=1 Tax=Dichotomopilus funicola TaxID=1934379 RepID=A0AAN6UV34_9PEZI|nr:hypothetical protein C8A04DRAFT_40955 [Dichotomopilus funicola]
MALPQGRPPTPRDLLFGGSADMLVRLLVVPVRPQSSSSTPARSRNGLKRKADGEGPPGSPRYHKRAKTQGGNDALAFSDLPPEIHQLVFDHIEFIEDVVCLVLASRYFWTFAPDYVHAYCMSFLGRWAAEELDTFQQRKADLWVPDDDHLEYVLCKEPFSLRHFTSPSVSVVEEAPDLGAESRRLYSHCRGRTKQEDSEFQATCSELVVTMSTYTPRDQPWILRNLTTKQFVWPEALALKPEYILVLSRIFWSTSSSVGIDHTTNISSGVWVKHCFDITMLARHQDDTDGEK